MAATAPALRLVYAAAISPAMALDNPQLQTQIEAGRQAPGMAGPDIKNIEALQAPIPGAGAIAPESETKHLDPLLASLNASAERFQTLWFSFLGLTLYFAIAALTTTHKDLLLGEPKTLPLLNIPVPLLPFYFIAPLLYLIFHFYLLMMLALLARTAAEFEKQLQTALPNEMDREGYRAQLENALFLQLLVGMRSERAGFNGFPLGVISLITIVIAPLVTLASRLEGWFSARPCWCPLERPSRRRASRGPQDEGRGLRQKTIAIETIQCKSSPAPSAARATRANSTMSANRKRGLSRPARSATPSG
jgi:hypothetical protein